MLWAHSIVVDILSRILEIRHIQPNIFRRKLALNCTVIGPKSPFKLSYKTRQPSSCRSIWRFQESCFIHPIGWLAHPWPPWGWSLTYYLPSPQGWLTYPFTPGVVTYLPQGITNIPLIPGLVTYPPPRGNDYLTLTPRSGDLSIPPRWWLTYLQRYLPNPTPHAICSKNVGRIWWSLLQ